jgi:hypothetical protein
MTVPHPPSGTTPAGFDTWATTVADEVNANTTELAGLPGTYGARTRVAPDTVATPLYLGATSAGVITANRFRWCPVELAPGTYSHLGTHLTAGGATGALVRLAIYSVLPTGHPGSRLVQTAEMSAEGTGNIEGAITYEHPGGWVFFSVKPNSVDQGYLRFAAPVIGMPMTAAAAALSRVGGLMWEQTSIGGGPAGVTTMPATAPSPPTLTLNTLSDPGQTGSVFPVMWARRSA